MLNKITFIYFFVMLTSINQLVASSINTDIIKGINKNISYNPKVKKQMFYICLDNYKDINKAKQLIQEYKDKNINLNYVYNSKTESYYIYVYKTYSIKDAEKKEKEINNNYNNKYSAPVYLIKIKK